MPNSLFISYRRSDSQHACLALAESLRWAFADGEVFFDRMSIEGADKWPATIENAVASARMVLVVIGSGWLKACDEYGRRRIDDPNDWVRQELLRAIAGNIDLLPVMLDGAAPIAKAALDEQLAPLAECQVMPVRVDSWDSDLHALIERIVAKSGIPQRPRADGDDRNPNGTPIPRPPREQKGRPTLSREEIRASLEDLSVWHLESNFHPWAIGGQAEEIARVYEFRSFENATRFMAETTRDIEHWEPPHHPRWENQWRVVKVWFTTWDVGCRVTDLDFKAAAMMEELYLKRDLERCA